MALSGFGASLLCDPRQWLHKYIILLPICFLSFGTYFVMDNPAALQDVMIPVLNINTVQFQGFYSIYSWPNVILSVFGGLLIDTILGLRLGAIIFSLFVTTGQFLFATGAYVNAYWLMMIGRFVFGLGGENLAVAQNLYSVAWFRGSALTLVMGLQMCFARVGSTVNLNVMEPLYNSLTKRYTKNNEALGVALYIGGFVCLFSLCCATLLMFFDKRRKRLLNIEESMTKPKLSDLLEIKKVLTFPPTFWLLAAICVFYYVTVFPFVALAQVFFEMKWGYTNSQANLVNSLIYLTSMGASPVFGWLIDSSGKNIIWLVLGCVSGLGCHLLLGFSFVSPFFIMICLGVSLSMLAAALWPAIAYIIPEKDCGTAYGVLQAIQNLGLAIIPLIEGVVVDKFGYLVLEVVLILMQVLAIVSCLLLYVSDASKDGILNMGASERKGIMKEREKGEQAR